MAIYPQIPRVIHSNVEVSRYLAGTKRARVWYVSHIIVSRYIAPRPFRLLRLLDMSGGHVQEDYRAPPPLHPPIAHMIPNIQMWRDLAFGCNPMPHSAGPRSTRWRISHSGEFRGRPLFSHAGDFYFPKYVARVCHFVLQTMGIFGMGHIRTCAAMGF